MGLGQIVHGVTGGISSLGSGIKSALMGQSPSDVGLPPGIEEAGGQRDKLAEMLMAQARGGLVRGDPLVAAIRGEGDRSKEQLASSQLSMAAGARGLGGLTALRQAQANTAQGQTRIGGTVADALARMQAQRQQSAQMQLAQLLRDREVAAMGAANYQQSQANPGLLPALTGVGGGLLGGLIGGGTGAKVGFQLGSSLGRRPGGYY